MANRSRTRTRSGAESTANGSRNEGTSGTRRAAGAGSPCSQPVCCVNQDCQARGALNTRIVASDATLRASYEQFMQRIVVYTNGVASAGPLYAPFRSGVAA